MLISHGRYFTVAVFTFERYEKKFLLTRQCEKRLLGFLLSELDMEFDSHCSDGGVYGIYNLYFDDENSSVIVNSLLRPDFKEKLRIRSYEPVNDLSQPVFLELKRKVSGIVTKRRITLPYSEALEFASSGAMPAGYDSYSKMLMLKEFEYYISRKALSPKVMLYYERTALFSKSDPSLRITFDQNITSRRQSLNLNGGQSGDKLLEPDERLMEIKFMHALPKKLCDFLSREKVFMHRFSKYGNEYSRLHGRDFIHISQRGETERMFING